MATRHIWSLAIIDCMKKLFQFLILTLPLIVSGQANEQTKWVNRGSFSLGELTLFAASKYIVPEGDLKYDSSYYYEGEFVILADQFDNELLNNESYLDIHEFEDEKCILEEELTFFELTNELQFNDENRIFLLPMHICSDYITGLTFQVSSNKIEKLFELDMYFEPEFSITRVNSNIYNISYKTDEGINTVEFNKQTKTIANKR